jgi:hypothetical protein
MSRSKKTETEINVYIYIYIYIYLYVALDEQIREDKRRKAQEKNREKNDDKNLEIMNQNTKDVEFQKKVAEDVRLREKNQKLGQNVSPEMPMQRNRDSPKGGYQVVT